MHSPGQSSAASTTSPRRFSAKEAKPLAPSGLPRSLEYIFPFSWTYANPSSSMMNTSGAISAHRPSPVHKSWSIQTFISLQNLLPRSTWGHVSVRTHQIHELVFLLDPSRIVLESIPEKNLHLF